MRESRPLEELQFVDLRAQRRRIEANINRAVLGVVAHGKYIMGPEVGAMERALADFVGVSHCVGCSSGTDALLMALMALGVGRGDAVITTPFTFVAAAEAVSLLGATPILADIDADTYNIDPDAVAEVAAKVNREGKLRLRGLIPVDLFGLPADYDRLRPIADRYEMFIVQDAAQSFGALHQGARVPKQGDISTTSFFPAKPLGCYGDGGAVFTNDGELAERLRSIRVHGKGTDKYNNVRIGLNARIDTIQAAVVLEKLQIFPDEIERRQAVARAYSDGLAMTDLQLPTVPAKSMSSWAQYTVQTDHRFDLMAGLKSSGIPTAVYYVKPLHLLEAFASLNYFKGSFPVAESVTERVVSLPFHPYLETEQIERICEAVKRFSS